MEQEQSIDKLTAIWLLPAIASIVCAGTGGNLCTVIPSSSAALPYTLIVSYILWGIGVPLALSILVLYVYRLIVYKVFSVEKVPKFTVCSFHQTNSVSVPSWLLALLVRVVLELFNWVWWRRRRILLILLLRRHCTQLEFLLV